MPRLIQRRRLPWFAIAALLALLPVGIQPVRQAATAAPVVATPVADTYANVDAPRTNFGSAARLATDRSPSEVIYLKFDIRGLTGEVASARLRLFVENGSTGSGGALATTSRTGWSESTLTWETRPAVDGPALTTLPAATRGSWVEADVTSAITGNGVVSFAISPTSHDGTEYSSREGRQPAQLVIETGAPVADPVVLAAGDIAHCWKSGDEATAALLDTLPGTVLTVGDNAYPNGAAADFANCYAPSWGRHKDRTRPTVGNHEYVTPGAAGYFGYFGAAAGDPKQGWYSFDLGDWHLVALNSNCSKSGGCDPDDPQATWLRADLAANPAVCTLAYFHHPRWSSGEYGDNDDMDTFWQIFDDAGVDVVLNGHEHVYERMRPLDADGNPDADGIRQFIIGTGGSSHGRFYTLNPASEVRDNSTFGVLELTLGAEDYMWRFVPVAGGTFSDSGSGSCHP